MRDLELLLRLLSGRVLSAKLNSGIRVLDASDFREWLLECSECAAQSETVGSFFDKLKS
jgi:hypothetical protein